MSYAQLEALRFVAACIGLGVGVGLMCAMVVAVRRP